ncbi:MAG: hypothetical protein ACRDTF_25335 [Pseudonocardiaceae bacterium]
MARVGAGLTRPGAAGVLVAGPAGFGSSTLRGDTLRAVAHAIACGGDRQLLVVE